VDLYAQEVFFKTGSGAINGGKLHVKLKIYPVNCSDVLNNPYRTSSENNIDQHSSEVYQKSEIKFDQNNTIAIFPNPANNEICIDATYTENIIGINISSVHNMQIVTFNSFIKCIDIKTLNTGLYFISIKQKNGTSKTFKFIKI